ncbi:MAG: glycoside hydrolase family 3 C-terminal domain-containing protein [Pyrinomonadaceae bacterium]
MFSLIINTGAQTSSVKQLLPYRDPKLGIDKRVEDLVSRMTLEEKVSQMMNAAAAIERLGVPEYEWWNEALHGVARAGVATVFPQAIGLAATFDEKLVHDMADVTSTEARAKHHEFVRRGERKRYQGLTFWSPNINIFRDPRWGRGQETWGEDPYLAGLLGSAFVRGLQGDDPKYLKTVSSVKHYAVHSGPEPERHAFDAVVSERDLQDTYLPQFRTTIIDAKAAGVMCAYNRINGEPACASKELADILFTKWKFKGHVVSDCGAIDNIYLRHKYVPTEGEASAISVKGGTDLTCGREYRSLVKAVKDGLITEREIDTSVKNLMRVRFRLGMFDPPEMVKYARIPFSKNDASENHALSLEASRRSLVLLKNDGNTLPLSKNLKSVAVIGPNTDDRDVMLGNYNGEPSVWATPLAGIRKIVSPLTKVLYSQGLWPAGNIFETVPASALSTANGKGLRGEYFDNANLSGEPNLVRTDERVDFNWGSLSPATGIKPDGFSVRWTGRITATDTGKATVGGRGNGPLRIWIDGKLVLEEVTNRRTRNALKEIDLDAGRSYDLKIEYQEGSNANSQMRLVWNTPSSQTALRLDAIEKAKQVDAVIMVMGISPRVEGEEMDVQLEGFRGGDRTDIALPKPQQQLIKDIHALGKPVVLVTMAGSALALNWENDNLPAIIHAWYPGQFGGTAIAETIFGDYNPAGRLPVTFYKSVDQLPPFDDYKMEGRTYRYFRGEPLYPFGYGLSYSRFEYSGLRLPKSVSSGRDLTVSALVKNAGTVAGDEVVQVYLTANSATAVVPIRSLVGVQRIRLQPGESRIVKFTVASRYMSIVLRDGKRVLEPGDFSVSVGGEQPAFTGSAKAKTTMTVGRTFKLSGKGIQLPE